MQGKKPEKYDGNKKVFSGFNKELENEKRYLILLDMIPVKTRDHGRAEAGGHVPAASAALTTAEAAEGRRIFAYGMAVLRFGHNGKRA